MFIVLSSASEERRNFTPYVYIDRVYEMFKILFRVSYARKSFHMGQHSVQIQCTF